LRPLGHDARLVIERGRPVVEVNNLLHPWYRSFCIAHELGHLIVGRVSSRTIMRGGSLGPEVDIENLCNRLARELVIPAGPLAPRFPSDRTCLSAVAEAAELFEVPVDIMAARVFGDLGVCSSSSILMLRRDNAGPPFKGRIHSTLIRPPTAPIERASVPDRIVRGPALSAVVTETEACGQVEGIALRDDGCEYWVSAIAFDFLRLAAPLVAEPGALLLIHPVIQPRIN
jgi:hypothetical protein